MTKLKAQVGCGDGPGRNTAEVARNDWKYKIGRILCLFTCGWEEIYVKDNPQIAIDTMLRCLYRYLLHGASE